jgi:GH18 family chitinase
VKYNVYGGNQWISYDDQQSFTDKMTYLTSHCISGAMIWAIDEDDPQYDALTGLLGEEAMQGSLVQGGALTNAQKITLASQ